jgi:hypothetical protein
MTPAFPVLRWVAVVWLAIWVPSYWRYWGWRNFLQLCDVNVLLTCAGLWWGDALLLSSQAVSAAPFQALWCVDVAGRLLLGRHPFGGSEYMWDRAYPRWVRLLSCFHIVLPVVLLYAVRTVGYDADAWTLQAAITAPVLVASRLLGRGRNVNFTECAPVFNRQIGPAALHVTLAWLIAAVLYGVVHLLLLHLLPPA